MTEKGALLPESLQMVKESFFRLFPVGSNDFLCAAQCGGRGFEHKLPELAGADPPHLAQGRLWGARGKVIDTGEAVLDKKYLYI